MAVREVADQLSKSGKPGLIIASVISPGSVATLVATLVARGSIVAQKRCRIGYLTTSSAARSKKVLVHLSGLHTRT